MPLIDWQIETNRERKNAAYRRNLEGITSLCWNWAEYKIVKSTVDSYAGTSFPTLFLLQEAQGAFTKSHLINQGYLQLIKSNNPVYYSICYSHIFPSTDCRSAFESHHGVEQFLKKG